MSAFQPLDELRRLASAASGSDLQMGGSNSKENGPEATGVVGKLGGLPRAAAITAGGGKRTKGGQPVLPPNTIKSQADDWQFIEVTTTWSLCLYALHLLHCCTLLPHKTVIYLLIVTHKRSDK